MTLNQINGIIRAVIPALFAFLAAKGIGVSDATVAEITTAVVTLVAAAWSVYSNRKGVSLS